MLDSATATELPHEQHDNARQVGNPPSTSVIFARRHSRVVIRSLVAADTVAAAEAQLAHRTAWLEKLSRFIK